MSKNLLFSITKKDLDIKYFRAGKHGGQKGDKTSPLVGLST